MSPLGLECMESVKNLATIKLGKLLLNTYLAWCFSRLAALPAYFSANMTWALTFFPNIFYLVTYFYAQVLSRLIRIH